MKDMLVAAEYSSSNESNGFAAAVERQPLSIPEYEHRLLSMMKAMIGVGKLR